MLCNALLSIYKTRCTVEDDNIDFSMEREKTRALCESSGLEM